MSHYTREQWQRYITNELGEDARRKCEDHLYHCDQCLELYLEALALCEADLPDMKSAVRFTDMVMEKIGQSAGDNPWETGAGENACTSDGPGKNGPGKDRKNAILQPDRFPLLHRRRGNMAVSCDGSVRKSGGNSRNSEGSGNRRKSPVAHRRIA